MGGLGPDFLNLKLFVIENLPNPCNVTVIDSSVLVRELEYVRYV